MVSQYEWMCVSPEPLMCLSPNWSLYLSFSPVCVGVWLCVGVWVGVWVCGCVGVGVCWGGGGWVGGGVCEMKYAFNSK